MIYLIVFLAALIRLVALKQSLWLDEAIGAIAARDYSYTGILTDFIIADNHSPLYYLTLKAWTSIFGYSEIAIRFPSVLFGIGTIWFAYLIAKLINSKINWKLEIGKWKFEEIAVFLLTISQFHI